MIFFERFTDLCKEQNATTTAIGTSLGFSKATISAWRNNRTQPKGASLARLSSYFEVSTDYLLGKSEIRQTDKALTDAEQVKRTVFGTEDIPEKAWLEFERAVAHLKRKYGIGKD